MLSLNIAELGLIKPAEEINMHYCWLTVLVVISRCIQLELPACVICKPGFICFFTLPLGIVCGLFTSSVI